MLVPLRQAASVFVLLRQACSSVHQIQTLHPADPTTMHHGFNLLRTSRVSASLAASLFYRTSRSFSCFPRLPRVRTSAMLVRSLFVGPNHSLAGNWRPAPSKSNTLISTTPTSITTDAETCARHKTDDAPLQRQPRSYRPQAEIRQRQRAADQRRLQPLAWRHEVGRKFHNVNPSRWLRPCLGFAQPKETRT